MRPPVEVKQPPSSKESYDSRDDGGLLHFNRGSHVPVYYSAFLCVLGSVKLYCFILFYFIALHCIALHCIALHCIASHCIALHRIALHCIARYLPFGMSSVTYRVGIAGGRTLLILVRDLVNLPGDDPGRFNSGKRVLPNCTDRSV